MKISTLAWIATILSQSTRHYVDAVNQEVVSNMILDGQDDDLTIETAANIGDAAISNHAYSQSYINKIQPYIDRAHDYLGSNQYLEALKEMNYAFFLGVDMLSDQELGWMRDVKQEIVNRCDYFEKAQDHYLQGRRNLLLFKEALGDVYDAIHFADEDAQYYPLISSKMRAKYHLLAEVIHDDLHQHSLSIAAFKRAVYFDEDIIRQRHYFAHQQYDNGEYHHAAQDLQKLFALNIPIKWLYFDQARIFYATDDVQKALDYCNIEFAKQQAQQPDGEVDYRLYFDRAQYHFDLGDEQKAFLDINKALIGADENVRMPIIALQERIAKKITNNFESGWTKHHTYHDIVSLYVVTDSNRIEREETPDDHIEILCAYATLYPDQLHSYLSIANTPMTLNIDLLRSLREGLEEEPCLINQKEDYFRGYAREKIDVIANALMQSMPSFQQTTKRHENYIYQRYRDIIITYHSHFGDHEKAQAMIDRYLDIFPNHQKMHVLKQRIQDNTDPNISTHHRQVAQDFEEKNYMAAFDGIQTAIARHSYVEHNTFGVALEKMKDHIVREAINNLDQLSQQLTFDKIIALQDEIPQEQQQKFFVDLAGHYRTHGDNDNALQALDKAMESDATFMSQAKVHALRMDVKWSLGKYDEFFADYYEHLYNTQKDHAVGFITATSVTLFVAIFEVMHMRQRMQGGHADNNRPANDPIIDQQQPRNQHLNDTRPRAEYKPAIEGVIRGAFGYVMNIDDIDSGDEDIKETAIKRQEAIATIDEQGFQTMMHQICSARYFTHLRFFNAHDGEFAYDIIMNNIGSSDILHRHNHRQQFQAGEDHTFQVAYNNYVKNAISNHIDEHITQIITDSGVDEQGSDIMKELAMSCFETMNQWCMRTRYHDREKSFLYNWVAKSNQYRVIDEALFEDACVIARDAAVDYFMTIYRDINETNEQPPTSIEVVENQRLGEEISRH